MQPSFSYVFFYVQANVFCLLVFALLLYKNMRGFDRQDHQILFGQSLTAHMLYFANDAVWALVDGGVLPRTPFTMGLSNVSVFVLACLIAYYWFLYSEVMQGSSFTKDVRERLRVGIPLLLVSLAVVVAFIAGFPYWSDMNGVVHNATYYFVLLAIPFGYVLATCIRAVRKSFLKENYLRKHELMLIGTYPLLLLPAGLAQVLFPRVPVLCFACTIAILNVYLNGLDELISLDPLTQLNNRNQLRRYLVGLSHERSSDAKHYLLIVDLDRFKQINDRFGHVEGDEALRRSADCLREACGHYQSDASGRPFLARYGGDEFVIVLSTQDEDGVRGLIAAISAEFERANSESEKSYLLEWSVGYAELTGDVENIEPCLAAADKHLYAQKRRHKAEGSLW